MLAAVGSVTGALDDPGVSERRLTPVVPTAPCAAIDNGILAICAAVDDVCPVPITGLP